MRISAVAAVLAFGVTFCAMAQQGAPVRTAEQQFKNIKVLKGVPANQVVPAMHLIEKALGVDCEFCHVEDRAADTKEPKETARMMIQMVMEINKNNFAGMQTVTCYTCHHGNADPITTPIIPTGEAMMADAPTEELDTSKLPTADQIVTRYVQALGGEANLRKVTSRSITATWEIPTGPGGTTPVPALLERYDKAPNMTLSISHTPTYTISQGFDGTSAWLQDAKGAVTDAPAIDQGHLKRGADFFEPLDLKKTYSSLSVTGVARVNGHDAYRVEGALPNGKPDQLFFDAVSGLLVRKVISIPTPAGQHPMAFEYDDYQKTSSGVLFPFTIRSTPAAPYTLYALFSHSTIHVQKVQDNAAVDDAKFAKPQSKPAGN
jgi:hypothetical protein